MPDRPNFASGVRSRDKAEFIGVWRFIRANAFVRKARIVLGVGSAWISVLALWTLFSPIAPTNLLATTALGACVVFSALAAAAWFAGGRRPSYTASVVFICAADIGIVIGITTFSVEPILKLVASALLILISLYASFVHDGIVLFGHATYTTIAVTAFSIFVIADGASPLIVVCTVWSTPVVLTIGLAAIGRAITAALNWTT